MFLCELHIRTSSVLHHRALLTHSYKLVQYVGFFLSVDLRASVAHFGCQIHLTTCWAPLKDYGTFATLLPAGN